MSLGSRPSLRPWRWAPLTLAAVLLASPLLAQEQDSLRRELRDSQLRLEQIRRERAQLQQEMSRLQTRVRDVTRDLTNIERQRLASESLLAELDFQTEALTASIEATEAELATARERLARRSSALRARLRAVYKEGPLHVTRVLLSARSFADLLNRYKYMHLIAVRDRLLIGEVTSLEADLRESDERLRNDLDQLDRLRAEQSQEFERLRQIESRHERTLASLGQQERQAQGRLQQLARDQARLTNLISELERRRLEAERRRAAAGGPAAEGTLSTRDLGSLNWPVDGQLIYRFGPERKPSGITLRWNGIGIGAAPGEQVRAVEAGTVVMAGPFEGYGPTVMVSHGGGYYTLYLYLGRIAVRDGQAIEAGQPIGTVGGERTPEGPHIEFQVRAPGRGGMPEPVDPLAWLRARAAR